MNIIRKCVKDAINDIEAKVKELPKILDNIDVEELDKEIQESQKYFREQITSLVQKAKKCNNKYTVKINFNRSTDNLSWTLSGSELEINVTALSDTSSSKYKLTLPADVDPTTLVTEYDAKECKMTFSFKRE